MNEENNQKPALIARIGLLFTFMFALAVLVACSSGSGETAATPTIGPTDRKSVV